MDVLFVNPANSKKIYQDLSKDYSAIETPTWSLLLAQSCRSQGYDVGILDALAENLDDKEVAKRVKKENPRLVCIVVYGQNPNSGTVNMSGTVNIANRLKKEKIKTPVCVVGSHVQALPYQVLKEESSIDMVCTNEGVYTLWNLLKEDLSLDNIQNLTNVKGLGFRIDGEPHLNTPEKIVPQNRMDVDLPGYAWDLLPYKDKPLDLYRAHFWHAEYKHENRTPFAALYTSLGCQFKCSFCMINILNRDNNDEIGVASNYSKMRFWSPEFIINEFDKLNEMGVKTIRIADEMFLLNRKYYLPLIKLLADRPYSKDLIMWTYSRVDTVSKPEILKLVRKAGIRWLCLGIESADRNVRLEVSKGKFKDVDITEVVKRIEDAGINVMANYMFGLPGDTHETMRRTLDLSKELCSMAWNAYAAMPLPGSQLYKDAVESGIDLPEDYAGYSFHAYTTKPLPTDELSPEEILKFRDKAYLEYHTYKPFLDKVRNKYGDIAADNILENTKIKLKRKILGD